MDPLKLYLLRAVYDWATANGFTPHLIVDARQDGVRVPSGFVQDGKIVLNVAPGAVHNFDLNAERVLFSARFGGKPYAIECPLAAVRAVYARENGQGVAFPDSDDSPPTPPDGEMPTSGPVRKTPVLKRVK